MEILVRFEDRVGNIVYKYKYSIQHGEGTFNRIKQLDNVWYTLSRVYIGDQFISITYQQEVTD